jgi:hypothetical protein
MLRTVGTLIVLLAIGTLAMAWSYGPASTGRTSLTIDPYEVHLKAGPLAAQEFNDQSFVF